MNVGQTYRLVRLLLAFFMLGLLIAGLTAFPLIFEVNILVRLLGRESAIGGWWPALGEWISFVHQGLTETSRRYPFMFYGTDWLAFAHIIIATAFIGPLRDPLKNIWVVQFGLLACLLLIPLALVCGPLRGIPWFWTILDLSFGVFGLVPLLIAYRLIKRIGREKPVG
jgi:hypothetical protein